MTEIWNDWELDIDADAVLRGQGADAAVIRGRRPKLVDVAERALEEGLPLIRPHVLTRTMTVKSCIHERILLEGGALRGPGIVQHLAPTQEVALMVCTIGGELEAYTSEMLSHDMVYGLALYGVGSAAVESLANAACLRLEQDTAGRGLQTTMPLSPGMIGWSVSEGQQQIFDLVDGSEIGVSLTEANIMVPLKSLSMVVGIFGDLGIQGRTCDYCAMRDVCRYQEAGGGDKG